MRRYGFTLAEVLFTLAIIGVVAAITLPVLISNTQERQAIAAFKKSMNTLNTVVQQNVTNNGFDYSGIAKGTRPLSREIYTDSGVLEQSIWAMMKSNAQIDEKSSINATKTKGIKGDCSQLAQIFFNDGTVLCYVTNKTVGSGVNVNNAIGATIDTNGRKGPNKLFTCENVDCTEGKSTGDQFVITLQGSNAIPGDIEPSNDGSKTYTDDYLTASYAASWAMRQ